MGFFKKKPPTEVLIPFDANWFNSWESLRRQQEAKPSALNIQVSFDGELLKEIWDSIESHSASPRILYDEEQQPLNNVGESYRQEQIANFCESNSAEDLGWISGFLMPEMANPHDKTAVAIYALKRNETGVDSKADFSVLHAGYMDKDSAKKVHKKILDLMGKDLFIPLLVRIVGGTEEKPNYGVFAYAKTNALKFP